MISIVQGTARSVDEQRQNPPLKRYNPFHTPGFLPHSPSHPPHVSSSNANENEAEVAKRAYINPLLDHLKDEYKQGSAKVLEWTEEQKAAHKVKPSSGSGSGSSSGVLKAAVVGEETGNTTNVAGAGLKAAAGNESVGFDAWPAGVKIIVHRKPRSRIHNELVDHADNLPIIDVYYTAKGNTAAGYSPNSLAILKTQSQRADDQDVVTHSPGGLAAQSVDYSIFSVDTGYIAEIEVGSAGKKYPMLIDTGS